jgi:16S rRNA processing protein RimM
VPDRPRRRPEGRRGDGPPESAARKTMGDGEKVKSLPAAGAQSRPRSGSVQSQACETALFSKLGHTSRYPASQLVLIGKLLKPHGLHGEIGCHPITDYPERFETTKRVQLFASPESPARELEVVGVRWQSRKLLLQLAGVSTVEQAAQMRNYWVAVGEDQLFTLDEGEFYHFQLEGLDVFDENGHPVGVLSEVLSTPAHEIYVVLGVEGEILVPAVPAYVINIDVAARRLQIRVPCESTS